MTDENKEKVRAPLPHAFTSETAPRTGRKKGAKNRKTLYSQFLNLPALSTANKRLAPALEGCNPADMPKTIEEQVIASIVLQALSGDLAAAKELMDGIHGKITEKVDMTNNINAMGTVKDDTGRALTFDIGSEPDKKLLTNEGEDDNE
jgi:hypothetical protein